MSNFVLTLKVPRDNITKLTREPHWFGEFTRQQKRVWKNLKKNEKVVDNEDSLWYSNEAVAKNDRKEK